MTTQEALSEIQSRGFPTISYWQLRHSLKTGKFPAPRLNSSKAWDWTAGDVENAMEILLRTRSPRNANRRAHMKPTDLPRAFCMGAKGTANP